MVGADEIDSRRADKFDRYERFLIFDIETVVDEGMLKEVGEERDLKRFHEGEFMHPAYHRVIAVSMMGIEGMRVRFFISRASRFEDALLKTFWNRFLSMIGRDGNNLKFPVLITVNGKNFDVPVVLLRSLKHIDRFDDNERTSVMHFTDMSAEKYDPDHPYYMSRFTRYHIDIGNDIFGSRVSLKKLAHLSGISAKLEGRGEDVHKYFRKGDLERIARYCAEDVRATALIFSRINRLLYGTLYRHFPPQEVIDGARLDVRVD